MKRLILAFALFLFSYTFSFGVCQCEFSAGIYRGEPRVSSATKYTLIEQTEKLACKIAKTWTPRCEWIIFADAIVADEGDRYAVYYFFQFAGSGGTLKVEMPMKGVPIYLESIKIEVDKKTNKIMSRGTREGENYWDYYRDMLQIHYKKAELTKEQELTIRELGDRALAVIDGKWVDPQAVEKTYRFVNIYDLEFNPLVWRVEYELIPDPKQRGCVGGGCPPLFLYFYKNKHELLYFGKY